MAGFLNRVRRDPRRPRDFHHRRTAQLLRPTVADLGAARMVPVHGGTFVLSGEPVKEPIEYTRAEWDRSGRDRADLWAPPIGGTGIP